MGLFSTSTTATTNVTCTQHAHTLYFPSQLIPMNWNEDVDDLTPLFYLVVFDAESFSSQCSKTCDWGERSRNVTCHRIVSKTPGSLVHPNKCDERRKPTTRERCRLRRCDDLYSWSSGPWSEVRTHSFFLINIVTNFYYQLEERLIKTVVQILSQCSESCGQKGFRKRNIFCLDSKGNRAPKKNCMHQTKPQKRQKCNRSVCKYFFRSFTNYR